jgi:hypothetical protein
MALDNPHPTSIQEFENVATPQNHELPLKVCTRSSAPTRSIPLIRLHRPRTSAFTGQSVRSVAARRVRRHHPFLNALRSNSRAHVRRVRLSTYRAWIPRARSSRRARWLARSACSSALQVSARTGSGSHCPYYSYRRAHQVLPARRRRPQYPFPRHRHPRRHRYRPLAGLHPTMNCNLNLRLLS